MIVLIHQCVTAGGEKEKLEAVPDPPRPAGSHNIIKHPRYVGICLDCGLRGDWESIKATHCPGKVEETPELEAEEVGGGEITELPEDQAFQVEAEKSQEAASDGVGNVVEENVSGEDVMEEASLIIQLLELEEEEYALEYEELQLIELLAKESAQAPLKAGHDRRPPATPCASASMPHPPQDPLPLPPSQSSLFGKGLVFLSQVLHACFCFPRRRQYGDLAPGCRGRSS